MRRIIECLLEEGILEEDIHRILDLIEEEYDIISEINVSSETAGKIFQRKANQLNALTSERGYHQQMLNNATNDSSKWHDNHPGATIQDRYNYESKQTGAINNTDNKANRMIAGGQRILRAAANKQMNKKLTTEPNKDYYTKNSNLRKAINNNLKAQGFTTD